MLASLGPRSIVVMIRSRLVIVTQRIRESFSVHIWSGRIAIKVVRAGVSEYSSVGGAVMRAAGRLYNSGSGASIGYSESAVLLAQLRPDMRLRLIENHACTFFGLPVSYNSLSQ